MTTRNKQDEQQTRAPQVKGVNEIRLVGTVPVVAQEKTMPSGDTALLFRVAVRREEVSGQRASTDSLECVAWDARVKRSVSRWRVGDIVEVQGALRRRFFRTPAGTGSRVEVEVRAAKVIRRALT